MAGLLSPDYWKKATQEAQIPQQPAPQSQPQVAATPTPAPTPAPAVPTTSGYQPPKNLFDSYSEKIIQNNQLTPEQQTQKYGGVVGSTAYYATKAQENPYVKVGSRLGPYIAAGAAVGAFGGPVGIAVGALIGAGLGASSFPVDTTWDTLTPQGKADYLWNSGWKSTANMVTSLPSEIIKTPIRAGVSAAQPWIKLAQGKDFSFQALANEPQIDIPLLGKVPTYYQSFDEAKKSGMSPLAASMMTAGTALGDALIVGSIGEAATAAFRPRAGAITPMGETKVANTQPVQELITRDQTGKATGVARSTPGAAAEYYSLPQTTAKQFGGHSGNTFFKLTPASPDSVELAVVQTRSGAVQRAFDKVTRAKVGQGTFGPEVKIQSQIIKTGDSVAAPTATTPELAPLAKEAQKYSSAEEFVKAQGVKYTDPEIAFRQSFTEPLSSRLSTADPSTVSHIKTEGDLVSIYRGQSTGEKGLLPGDFVAFDKQTALNYVKKPTDLIEQKVPIADVMVKKGAVANEGVYAPKGVSSLTDFYNQVRGEGITQGQVSIPGSVTKGFESKPITNDQLSNLAKIGDVNGVAPAVRDAVIRTVSGKSVMGEMTQAEYVKSAQTLGLFNGASKYVANDTFLNPVGQYLSPQRRWMRTYEEHGGFPIYSEAYVPLEDAMKSRDVFRNVWRGQSREIFGKYANPGYSAERQALYSYMRGDTSAIVGNSAFDAATQADLVKVANGMRGLYDKVGPQMNVPPEIFLKDYQPYIQNIGGVFQLYKEGSTVPKSMDFFAKFKRTGNAGAPLVDDALALFDMYVNAGSNSTFVGPVMERVGPFADSLPGTLKGSVNSYIQEKLGHAGRLEQAMDEMIPALNRKLGTNLPPDAARRLGDTILSTQYAGLLSQPATWVRQFLQYPLLGYARLGPKFATQAYVKALAKGGLKELQDKGLLVDTTYPYGGALAQEQSTPGRVASAYKTTTQAVISPNSTADNVQRAVVYYQFKAQFETALQRFNDGKISWPQFEKDINMQMYSPIDQNIARQRIVAGDTVGAFDHLVRDVIDETQFPYRKASTARLGYGFGGKAATSLLQWPLEASHTLGSWMKYGKRTGDFSPFIRYFAASTAINRTLKDTFGLDFTRSLFLGPVLSTNFVAPIPGLMANTFTMIMNSPWVGAVGGANSRQTFNDSADAVLKTLNAAGYPGALEIRNINSFKKSIDRGPDANGQYAAFDAKGGIKYTTDFAGIFMGELMGFPIDEKVRSSTLNTDMYNAQVDQQTAKAKVMELLQQEKYDQASQLMSTYGIKVTPQDLDNYYIPSTQRVFQSLPASIKAQFAPRVFPEAFQGVQ